MAAGSLDGLAALKAAPPPRPGHAALGGRRVPHRLHGRRPLRARGPVGGLRPAQPSRLLISNKDGSAVETGAGVLNRLVSQITNPVRFDACLDTLRELGVTAVIELPPAGALAVWPSATGRAPTTSRSWPSAARPTSTEPPSSSPPSAGAPRPSTPPTGGSSSPRPAGTISPAAVAEGTALPAGATLATVAGRRETVEVAPGYAGLLAEWLVFEGDLVDAGDPIARLYPEV